MDLNSENTMKLVENIHILITERNSRVREFLKREMEAEGYVVRLAENGREMLDHVYHPEPLDLIILDPDLPDANVPEILKLLKERIPRVTIVFHTYIADYEEYGKFLEDAVFVEKQGNSIVGLKNVISTQLKTKNTPIETG